VMSPGGDVVVVDGEREVVDFPFIQSLVVGIGEFVLPNKELETAPQACLNRRLVKLIMTLSRMAISRRE
jgi:hypothetical protein